MDDYFNQAVAVLGNWDNHAHTLKDYAMAMLYGLDNAQGGDAQQQARLQTEYTSLLSKFNISLSDINTFDIDNLNAASSDKLPTSGCP